MEEGKKRELISFVPGWYFSNYPYEPIKVKQ